MHTRENRLKSFVRSLGLLGMVFLAGCGESGGGAQPGVLSASITDAPACGFDQVNVTIAKVRVHQSGSAPDNAAGWSEITLTPPRKINLLTLNDPTQPNLALEALGETPLAPGHYTQGRLVLAPNSNNPNAPLANSVVLSGQNAEVALSTPSGLQSGIKLINQFSVASGQRVDLLLDFDACRSVVARSNGTYVLKPVVRVIPLVLNGIEGFVDPALLDDRVSVTAQVNGSVVRATMPNIVTGKFFLARLDAPATYDVVVTADGHASAVLAGVPVASGTSITAVSTEVDPISLQPSTFQTIDGTATLIPADDDGSVLVSAKQTLAGGPTVTVRSKVATLLTDPPAGDYGYALSLPIAAPALGQYGTTLPITLTAAAQVGVAGVYAVHGAAETDTTVYTTQTPAPSMVNISGGSATRNFTLAP